MPRHTHMLDLLRPDLTIEEQVYTLSRKQELTMEDLDTIIESAEKVITAVNIYKEMF